MLYKTLFCGYMGKDSNSIERNQRFSWGLYGGGIKSTKSLISGENIDEPIRAGLIHSPGLNEG